VAKCYQVDLVSLPARPLCSHDHATDLPGLRKSAKPGKQMHGALEEPQCPANGLPGHQESRHARQMDYRGIRRAASATSTKTTKPPAPKRRGLLYSAAFVFRFAARRSRILTI